MYYCITLAFVNNMLIDALIAWMVVVLVVEVMTTGVIATSVDVDGFEREGHQAQSACEEYCQQIPSAEGVCKAFARAIPRPKLGRTCVQKFQEGWAFTCPLLCSGEDAHLYHRWIDRLTHHACKEMSSHIPYPAVFNSCKTGYRNGFIAARTAVSNRQRQERPYPADRSEEELGPQTCSKRSAEHPQRRAEDETRRPGCVVEETEKARQSRRGRSVRGRKEDAEAWMDSWETPLEYVDYIAIARERVSTSRRTKGSDVSRGPACPVCSG